MKEKLIIVSNRLPVSISRTEEGVDVRQSSGGLVSAMLALPDAYDITWIGAADFDRETWEAYDRQRDRGKFNVIPVFLDKETEDLYYNGFSNGLVWPLFHYFPNYAAYEESQYKAYRQVNRQFAAAVKEVAGPDDIIWVHDYHFMLLPGFLAAGKKKLTCSFFLHIPFPSYEIVKLIPEDWRTEILNGLLACDIAGFHTAEYSSHFKRALSYFLGVETVNGVASVNGHSCRIDHFPISVDFAKFDSAYDDDAVRNEREAIRARHSEERIIFSLDRLDYSKGVINRLLAYEQLLEQHRGHHGKIVFIINVIPSREKIAAYLDRKRAIEENIARINGLYGSIHWQPVIYQYRHLSFAELMACYTACDVALVTPLRDGMNLVAKEFVASRRDEAGVLILSEFAGAAHELTDAIHVNPNDQHLMTEALMKAISLPAGEQTQRMRTMRNTVHTNDITRWATEFIGRMKEAKNPAADSPARHMSFAEKVDIFDAYRSARRRLILLDYDGTLVQFREDPRDAAPGDVIKDLIADLARSRRNRVVLISGRDADTLQQWFEGSSADIAAEHGCVYRLAGKGVWVFPGEIPMDWKDEVRACVKKYADEVPGSIVEEKKYAIAWHYRRAQKIDEEAVRLALSKELLLLNGKQEFDILHGNKVIEVRSAYTNKGKFISRLLTEEEFDFVLAIGDDTTDEDMFNVLTGKGHFTVKVGGSNTAARYSLASVTGVVTFLEQLCNSAEVRV